VFVAVASIAGIWEYSSAQHYGTVATPIGASLIMFFSYAVFTKSRLKGFLLTSPFIILLLLALSLLPGRSGPLFAGFAFLVIILIDIFYTNPFSRRVLKTGFYLLIGLLVLYFYQNYSSPRQAHRMHRLFTEIGSERRTPLLLDTVHKIIDNPMGYGMGSSMRIVGFYPHNMFLESMLEFGILPTLVFFLVVIVYPIQLFVLAIKNKDQLLLSISVLILYLFLIFSVSYSVAHMYMCFSVVSLALSHQNIVSLQKMEGKI
jgi:O-antigen ligase